MSATPLESYLKRKLSGSSTPSEEYFALLVFTVARFQLLEEELKEYVIAANEVVEVRTKDVLEYRWSKADVLELPLRPLLKAFKRLGGDSVLAGRIESLVEGRNRLAHRGFIGFPGNVTSEEIMKRLPALRKMAADVVGLPMLVAKEIDRVYNKAGMCVIRFSSEPLDVDDASTPSDWLEGDPPQDNECI